MNNKNKCYKTSNNKYFGLPPRMDDGRHFTDYRGNCSVNNLIRENKEINNSFKYRMFLTKNANKIMDINRMYSCQKNCSSPCQESYNIGKSSKEETCEGILAKPLPKNYCTPDSDNFNYHAFKKQEIYRKTIPGGGSPFTGGDPETYQ